MPSSPRLLRTAEEIAAAGAAAVAGWPPLTDAQVTRIAVLLAPLADRPECWQRIPEKQEGELVNAPTTPT